MSYSHIEIGIISDNDTSILAKKQKIITQYQFVDIDKEPSKIKKVKILILLGGDGFMLHSIHRYMFNKNLKFFGLNCGNLGFLLNSYNTEDLISVINEATISTIFPLKVNCVDSKSNCHFKYAINEISLLRVANQIANLEIRIDNNIMISCLRSDGILLATPAGSSAYNFSVRGPIIPIGTELLSMVPISPFRPRHWRGVLLKTNHVVNINVLDPIKRPVNLYSDFHMLSDITSAEIIQDNSYPVRLLFDKKKSLDDKMLEEQFIAV